MSIARVSVVRLRATFERSSGKGPLMKSVVRLTAIVTLVSLATLIAKANY